MTMEAPAIIVRMAPRDKSQAAKRKINCPAFEKNSTAPLKPKAVFLFSSRHREMAPGAPHGPRDQRRAPVVSGAGS